MEQTVRTLGEALNMAWQAQVPVIRLSVAPESAFDAALLAGPRHPALGALIQAEALLRAAENAVNALGRAPERLTLPQSCQGFMYGDRGALKSRWQALGWARNALPLRAKPRPPSSSDTFAAQKKNADPPKNPAGTGQMRLLRRAGLDAPPF